jgi:hypothetical protein
VTPNPGTPLMRREQMHTGQMRNAMTVDVEDYFQV